MKLTDYEDSVLLNLQGCVAANRSQGTPTLSNARAHRGLDLQQTYRGKPQLGKDACTSGPRLEGRDADTGNARQQSSACDMVHLLSVLSLGLLAWELNLIHQSLFQHECCTHARLYVLALDSKPSRRTSIVEARLLSL